jgi:hypothetical protein
VIEAVLMKQYGLKQQQQSRSASTQTTFQSSSPSPPCHGPKARNRRKRSFREKTKPEFCFKIYNVQQQQQTETVKPPLLDG